MFALQSAAFQDRARIPRLYTCEGRNISPPLSWQGVPDDVKSFALVCEDPDAPSGTWYHWAIWNIPGDWRELPENFVPGASIGRGINSFGKAAYGGPCPPPGHGPHHYHFRLFALDVESLPIGGSVRCGDVAEAASEHAAGVAQLIGLYER